MSDDPSLLLSSPILEASVSGPSAAEASCSEEHQVQLLQKQLQQQEQQALAASAQVLMAVVCDIYFSVFIYLFFVPEETPRGSIGLYSVYSLLNVFKYKAFYKNEDYNTNHTAYIDHRYICIERIYQQD